MVDYKDIRSFVHDIAHGPHVLHIHIWNHGEDRFEIQAVSVDDRETLLLSGGAHIAESMEDAKAIGKRLAIDSFL
jgi:hypothetical protein